MERFIKFYYILKVSTFYLLKPLIFVLLGNCPSLDKLPSVTEAWWEPAVPDRWAHPSPFVFGVDGNHVHLWRLWESGPCCIPELPKEKELWFLCKDLCFFVSTKKKLLSSWLPRLPRPVSFSSTRKYNSSSHLFPFHNCFGTNWWSLRGRTKKLVQEIWVLIA